MSEENNRRVFIAATGAGAGAQHDLWKVPGCSKYFAGAAFPYSRDQMDEFLGFKSYKYCSEEISIDMAMESYRRAWNERGCDAIGIGLAASVASTERHRGEHEIFAACVTANGIVIACHHVLKKGKGDVSRARDGSKADRIITGLLKLATGHKVTGLEAYLATDKAIEQFFKKPFFDRDGTRHDRHMYPDPGPLYFGAFNPPHAGHLKIARTAGHTATFCITQDGPHKPTLTLADLLQRSKLLKGERVLFSRGDPLFIDKARLAPGTSFVVGSDSLDRFLDPKWGPDIKEMLYEFVSLYTTFLVAPRIVDGQLLTMDQVLDKRGIDFQVRRDLFKELAIEASDLSSSQIRNGK